MADEMSVDGKASSPLKRPRSESSSGDEEVDHGTPYQPTPGGGRPEKDRLICDQCGLTFRKHSDLKKHNARHSRSYRCIEEGCPRSQIGFATINDLYRHEKSVHGKHVGKSRMYRCFAPGCAKASKLWPRLDNFKQHLIRMHPSEDVEALVKKSEQWHADEEGDGGSLPDGHSQESVISSLQNVKRLRSPPRGLGGLSEASTAAAARRWDLTPPTTAVAGNERRTDLRQILDPTGNRPIAPQANGDRPIQPSPAPGQIMQPPPPPQGTPGGPPAHIAQHPSSAAHTSPTPNTNAPTPNPSDPPRLQPSDQSHISRPSEVRELSTEARCRSCVWNNRRCYVDQGNPRHCVSCRSREECIFRRTVIRDAPADFFTWSEVVGVEHLPGGMVNANPQGSGVGVNAQQGGERREG